MIALLKQKTQSHFITVAFSLMLALVGLTVLEDFIHAIRNNYSFYLSESLLFNTFWLVFLPLFALFFISTKTIKPTSYKQLTLSVLVLVVAHISLTSITISGLSNLLFDQGYSLAKVSTYTVSNDLITLVLIYGFFVGYAKRLITLPVVNQSASFLMVKTENRLIKIQTKNILLIQAATPYVSIQLQEKNYLHASTLKSIQDQLDSRFVRIHKSTIVNTDQVMSCESRFNGDYDLTLNDNSQTRLSRNYVADFRRVSGIEPQLKT